MSIVKNIQLGLATESQVNQEFIDAWHRSESNEIRTPEERLYFLEPKTLLRILSNHRLALLHTLRSRGETNIRMLSKALHRNYESVYQDVQILIKAGLIHRTASKQVFVPWDKIRAEIDLVKERE